MTTLLEPRADVAAPPIVHRAVAVIVSRFPTVTETFIQHEIDELERQGQPVLLVPLLRDAPPVIHAQARAWIPRALYTPWLSPGIVAANLKTLVRHPRRYGALLARLVAGTITRPGVLARTLALFPKSVYLAERLRTEGVRHVHAHFATYPATTALVIATLAPRITMSFTAHAHDIFVDRALLAPKIARARFVRVISRFNRAFLTSRYPDEARGKLRVIHMGIPSGDPGRRAAPPPVPRLLCVAALKPYKGVHTLVEASARLAAEGARFECDVVGDGPERRRLERLVASAGLADNVRLLGARSQTEVAELLQRASVFVLPSVVARDGQMEGIPVALMEAMAAGLPVVAPALSGIPELIDDDVSGLLIAPGDVAALARALRRLIDDADLRARLARAGRRAVTRGFELEHTVAQLITELDRHNPALPIDVRRALVAPAPLEPTSLGCRRMRASRDALVLELLAVTDDGPRECVVKIARTRAGESAPARARARREHAALVRLERAFRPGRSHAAEDDGDIRPGVPRPLALDETRAAVWLERCAGRRLDHLVRAARFRRDRHAWAELREGFRAAGRWLARLQAVTEQSIEPGEALSALVARSAAALERSALPGHARAHARDRLVELASHDLGPGLRVVGRHGDFWPGNVFVAPGSVEAIDFEGLGSGLPCEDVGWFLVTLDLLLSHPLLARRRADLAQAFLSGYDDGSTSLVPAAIRLGRTAAAAVLVARLDPAVGRWHRALRRMLARG